jgi:hypothetical protein
VPHPTAGDPPPTTPFCSTAVVRTLDEVRHSKKKDVVLVSPLRLAGSFDGVFDVILLYLYPISPVGFPGCEAVAPQLDCLINHAPHFPALCADLVYPRFSSCTKTTCKVVIGISDLQLRGYETAMPS